MNPDTVKANYRRAMDMVGEMVTIRRYVGAGANRPWFDCDVRARVMDYKPNELVGSIVQGDRRLVILHEDLVTAQFALPLAKDMKARVRGKELNIEAVDDSTRRVGGQLIAYELQVRG
jgi:hypothetical protein